MNRSKTFGTACLVGSFLISGVLHAATQEAAPEVKTEASPPPEQPRKEAGPEDRQARLEAEIDKLINAFDLSPKPLPEIPDAPPPHEGAMIDMPEYRIEPPDLVLVEVLEALPGRPITGERLVRPDGFITMGFYGEVHVRGLTIEQARVKIIKHLRKFLSDAVLGLRDDYPAPVYFPGPIPTLPIPPDPDRSPCEDPEKQELPEDVKGVSTPKATIPDRAKVRSVSDTERGPSKVRRGSRNTAGVYLTRGLGSPRAQEPGQDGPEKTVEVPVKSIKIPLNRDDEISIRIEVKEGAADQSPFDLGMAMAGIPEKGEFEAKAIPPNKSDRLFIDVTAYNSKNYFVLGDVQAAGRIPITGNETVLDALQYAGGFIHTADPKNIRLVRPGRNGKTGKVYKVDLEAIQERGETATNYQIFPNDRLIVGRNEVVKKTIQMDRLSSAMNDVITSIQQEAIMVRAVKLAAPDQPELLIKNLVEFWIKELNRPEGAVFNEETIREALLRNLTIKPDAHKPEK